MFSTWLAFLSAGLAAVDWSTVLQDGKQPAANFCASGLQQGKDRSSSWLSCLWGSEHHQSHTYQGNTFIQFLPTRSVTNLGMHFTMSCLSAVPHHCNACACNQREKKEHLLLTSWLNWEVLKGPLFSAPKLISKTTTYHCICCYTLGGQKQSMETVFQNQHAVVPADF